MCWDYIYILVMYCMNLVKYKKIISGSFSAVADATVAVFRK